MTPSSSALTNRLRVLQHKASRLRQAVQRRYLQGPYQGYVDGIAEDGVIRGWVTKRRSGAGRLPVALYAGKHLLEAGYANLLREDVRGTTGGDAECGFQFVLTGTHYAKVTESGGRLSVWTHGPDRHLIGELRLDAPDSPAAGSGSEADLCRAALRPDLEALLALLDDTPPDTGPLPPTNPAPLTAHDRMFTTDRIIPEVPDSGQPAYLDYIRYRYRRDELYAVEAGNEAADRFLYWHLTAYRAQERRRTPLSRDQIAYLNEPLVMGGQRHALSRIIWWRLVERRDMLGRLNLNDRDAYLDLLFWWAFQDAPTLYAEDCLVPDRFVDMLRGIHPSRRDDPWPLSYFTERFYLGTPRLHFLPPGSEAGRKTLLLAMLVSAARRPDLLRYMPRGETNRLLAPNPDNPQQASDFEVFVNLLAAPDSPISLSRSRFAAALRRRQFDLDSYSFLTRDAQGNRFDAAAMPRPDQGEEVDVQLIGPLAKASGLGQATRLSSDILRATGLSMRGVDFDLDNPAPEGFSSDTLIEDYGPARINLIHLNAESIPLAFAYQPDVFSGSYNIGYFFWELDKPAYCHYLGMELLDEIWVSTDYGVQIYQPDAKGKPVINVGMCYEEAPDITRADARDFVNRRFRLNDSHYVCLVAFDSFSFVQRKNPVSVLRAFQQAFEGVANARLIVKTQNRDQVLDPVQVKIWDQVDAIISGDSRIVVINETLSYRDLLRLKAGSDCYVSLHKSEGWGFGMIEAMNLGVPVVCTAYSGNMDFCTEDTVWLVDYEKSQLRPGDYIFVRDGSEWAEPSVDHAATQLRACYDDAALRAAKAQKARNFIRTDFSREAIAQRYGDRLRNVLKGRPT